MRAALVLVALLLAGCPGPIISTCPEPRDFTDEQWLALADELDAAAKVDPRPTWPLFVADYDRLADSLEVCGD